MPITYWKAFLRIEDYQWLLGIEEGTIRNLRSSPGRVACPNFGHPSFTKYKFLQVKNSFATIVNGLSGLKLFQLSNGYLFFS